MTSTTSFSVTLLGCAAASAVLAAGPAARAQAITGAGSTFAAPIYGAWAAAAKSADDFSC